jgi:hypothetical protein
LPGLSARFRDGRRRRQATYGTYGTYETYVMWQA